MIKKTGGKVGVDFWIVIINLNSSIYKLSQYKTLYWGYRFTTTKKLKE